MTTPSLTLARAGASLAQLESRGTLGTASEDLPRSSDGYAVAALTFAVHATLAIWASSRFPPAADGSFYHVIAQRIATGQGYTWLWPDASVTYAAHYPVGYPALVGLLYALCGPYLLAPLLLQALCAALGTFAVQRLAASVASRRGALLAALLVGLSPGLVSYTPALMTEAVVGALLSVLLWLVLVAAQARPWRALSLAGVGLGLLCLMRPQFVLLAPALAFWVSRRRWLRATLCVVTLVFVVTAPWTARNCQHMGRCVWVSANGGWNLLIGTAAEGQGAWVPLERVGVPAACRDVFGEAQKDQCFGQAAVERIGADVLGWLALVPAKLGATFNAGGAGAYYLNASNPAVVDERWRSWLTSLDTVWQRLTLGAALVALARAAGPWSRSLAGVAAARERLRQRLLLGLALGGVGFLLTPWAWPACVALLLCAVLLGRGLLAHPPAFAALVVLAATLVTHAVFFGAGRYALVVSYVLGALAGSAFPRQSLSRV